MNVLMLELIESNLDGNALVDAFAEKDLKVTESPPSHQLPPPISVRIFCMHATNFVQLCTIRP